MRAPFRKDGARCLLGAEKKKLQQYETGMELRESRTQFQAARGIDTTLVGFEVEVEAF